MSVDGNAPDALTLLRRQHLEVEDLFRTLERLQPEAQGSGASYLDQRRELRDLVVRKLMIHSGIEEEHFYPALTKYLDDGDPLVEQAVKHHTLAEQSLDLLEGKSPDNVDFDGDLRELISRVREHVRFEETEIFPRVERALTQAQLLDLGATLHKAMKHAPTHPHPHTPPATTGLGRVLAKGAAVADRMRDVAGGRARG